MNWILISLGIICLIGAAYGLLRTKWSRTEDGLIKGDPGVYYEPWHYYLRWLLGLGGAIFLIVLGLVF
jgi:hypothetical protein